MRRYDPDYDLLIGALGLTVCLLVSNEGLQTDGWRHVVIMLLAGIGGLVATASLLCGLSAFLFRPPSWYSTYSVALGTSFLLGFVLMVCWAPEPTMRSLQGWVVFLVIVTLPFAGTVTLFEGLLRYDRQRSRPTDSAFRTEEEMPDAPFTGARAIHDAARAIPPSPRDSQLEALNAMLLAIHDTKVPIERPASCVDRDL